MSKQLDSEFELRRQARTADDTHVYIASQGWFCLECQHRHCGEQFAYICVGCPCERRHPSLEEFDQARRITFTAEIVHATDSGVLMTESERDAPGRTH